MMTKMENDEKNTKKVSKPKEKTNTKAKAKAKPSPKPKDLKVSQSDQNVFPYSLFPVKVIHKDGKDLSETKICYFQSELYAKKYIDRCKFKKNEYKIFIKPEKA